MNGLASPSTTNQSSQPSPHNVSHNHSVSEAYGALGELLLQGLITTKMMRVKNHNSYPIESGSPGGLSPMSKRRVMFGIDGGSITITVGSHNGNGVEPGSEEQTKWSALEAVIVQGQDVVAKYCCHDYSDHVYWSKVK